MTSSKKLDELSHAELLATTRTLLAEADALSSRIAAVNEISVAINQTLDLDTILRVVAKQAKWLMDFDHCSVCLERDDEWVIIPLFGVEETCDVDLLETDNIGHVLKYKHPRLFREGGTRQFLADYPSQIILPLSASGLLMGTINFSSKEAHKYTQDDMRIGYMLSLQISSALRNAQIVQQLNSTQEELKLRIDDLDAYNYTIAHDLKSPLSNILLTTQIMQMRFTENLPEKGLTSLKSIERSTTAMNEMIDRLLWLAKIRKFEDAMGVVQTKMLIESVKLRFTTLLSEKQITLTVEDDLPDVIAHLQWLEEVFANLISNAIKYMGEDNTDGQIIIRAKIEGDMVRYEVQDNGIGIKDEDQKTLFEMFSRVKGVKGEGTGLGLSIVSRIIKRMGGTFGVTSKFGEGSTFWFTLKQHASDTIANSVNSLEGASNDASKDGISD